MHVIQRGNNRAATFFQPSDYRFYLDRLDEAAAKHGCLIHAYVLMTNHVHVLLTPLEPAAVSGVMQDLGRSYVKHVNQAYGRTGTLWEGRFKASLVDAEDYFLTCCRYIELNPVRAGIVAAPADYAWSSYRCNALGEPNRYVTPHAIYRALGRSPDECRRAYRSLFERTFEEETLTQIRTAINCGWPTGGERFKDEIEAALNRAARPPKRGRPFRTTPLM
jgi:putative transposase